MARIRCPGCGKVEDVSLRGRFLATCDDCHKQFVVYIIGQRVTEGVEIICPACGSAHKSTLIGLEGIWVVCNHCGHNFRFPPA